MALNNLTDITILAVLFLVNTLQKIPFFQLLLYILGRDGLF